MFRADVFPCFKLLSHPPCFQNINAAPEKDSEFKDKDMEISVEDEISEDDCVKKAYAIPSDTRDHEFVEKLDRSIEVDHFQQAELKQNLNLMTMVDSVYVPVTQPEETQVHQAEVNQELGSILIRPREHSGEELEEGRAAQAGLEQECDSMPIDCGEHACMTSYACTDDEQVEMEQKITSATADVLEFPADIFNYGTNTWKGKMLRS